MAWKNYGGKMDSSGRVTYPSNSKAPQDHRDRVQAYSDWNYGRNGGNSDYRDSNGSATYQREYDRLSSLRPGDSVWGGSSGSGGYSRSSGSGGGGAYRSYLDDARRSAMDAQRARVQSAIDTVAAQQAGINSTADKNAQQAYIAKEQALANMPQQLASLGQSGGASESALLGLNTGYENNRNSIFENRDKAIQQNQQQQNQIRASGDASIADIENAYASKLAQFEAEQEQYERQRQDQLNDIQSQRDYDRSVWERNNAYAAKLAAQKASQTGAGSKTSSSPSFSNLMKLYDTTGDPKYLEAAEQSVGIVGQTASGSYSPEISNYISQIDSIVRFNQNRGLPYQYGLAEGINRKYQNGELTKEQAEAIARKYGL